MPSSWDREMMTFSISLDGLEYQMKTLLESIRQGEFLKKDEDEGWLLYEDLADKTLSLIHI